MANLNDRQSFDMLAWDRLDSHWGNTFSWLRYMSTLDMIGRAVAKKAGVPETDVEVLGGGTVGSFNVIYPLRMKGNSLDLLVRIPIPHVTQLPDERYAVEAGASRFIRQNTLIPTPTVFYHAPSSENPDISPFLVIEKIPNKWSLSEAFTRPRDPDHPDHPFMLDMKLPKEPLLKVYHQLAPITLQLLRHLFPHIGSLTQTATRSFDMRSRPVTTNMQAMLAIANIPQFCASSQERDVPFCRCMRNDFVTSADDCRNKYVARQIFRRLAREGKLSIFGFEEDTWSWQSKKMKANESSSKLCPAAAGSGPAAFPLWCDDFQTGIILVDDTDKVTGFIDWDFTYTAPAQFCLDPPHADPADTCHPAITVVLPTGWQHNPRGRSMHRNLPEWHIGRQQGSRRAESPRYMLLLRATLLRQVVSILGIDKTTCWFGLSESDMMWFCYRNPRVLPFADEELVNQSAMNQKATAQRHGPEFELIRAVNCFITPSDFSAPNWDLWQRYSIWYLSHIKRALWAWMKDDGFCHRLQILNPNSGEEGNAQPPSTSEIIFLLSKVATSLCEGKTSLSDISSALFPTSGGHMSEIGYTADHFDSFDEEDDFLDVQKGHKYQVVFVLLSSILLLYTPTPSPEPSHLQLQLRDPEYLGRGLRSHLLKKFSCLLTADVAALSFEHLLNCFGHLKFQPMSESSQDHKSIIASNVNYYILSKVTGIRVVWVDCLSLHLEFDRRTMTLKLFRFPSFCAMLAIPRKSKATIFDSIFQSQKGDFESCHTKAQSSTAYTQDFFVEIEAFSEKSTYRSDSDFPNLGDRLLELQDFVVSQDCGTLRALWYDVRDLNRFWTFWAVVVFGVTSIVLSMIQTVLAGLQLRC
ncbi:phosphotransferase [Diaporthe eres]|nr:phosphotransferase [Diaporthe eres]